MNILSRNYYLNPSAFHYTRDFMMQQTYTFSFNNKNPEALKKRAGGWSA